MENGRTKHPVLIVAAALSAVVAVTLVVAALRKSARMSEEYFYELPVSPGDTIDITGYYTVRTTTEKEVSISSAEITESDGGYRLTVFSDYLPTTTRCRIVSDGVLRSDMWGDGEITYRPALSSIKISFTINSHTLCELTK